MLNPPGVLQAYWDHNIESNTLCLFYEIFASKELKCPARRRQSMDPLLGEKEQDAIKYKLSP